jgi:hypothetical protein
MRKLRVYIYRNDLGDCTNGGVTSKQTSIWLCTNKEDALKLQEEINGPVLFLETAQSYGGGTYKRAYPASEQPKGHMSYMAGGNFVYSSDSRFREYFDTSYPISVHDRSETQEVYDILSR